MIWLDRHQERAEKTPSRLWWLVTSAFTSSVLAIQATASLLILVVLLFTPTAHGDVTHQLLKDFQEYATRDLIVFGAPKTLVLDFAPSANGYFVYVEKEIVGTAVTFERCLVQRSDENDLMITCYQGISAALNLCKIDRSICQKEGIREKVRELSIDPIVASGRAMKTIGRQEGSPHMRRLTNTVREYPSAKRALGEAMALNGCSSIEMGDIAGQVTYLEQNPLGDADTGELFEGVQNRWRAIMHCRIEAGAVYLDVVSSVENGEILHHLIPIKAVPAERVFIKKLTPVNSPIEASR